MKHAQSNAKYYIPAEVATAVETAAATTAATPSRLTRWATVVANARTWKPTI